MSGILEGNYDPWMYVATGVSLTLFVWSLYAIYQDLVALLPSNQGSVREEFSSPVFRILITFSMPLARLIAPIGNRVEKRFRRTGQQSLYLVLRRRVATDLRAGGSPENLTPDEFFALTVFSTFIFTVTGYLCYISYPYFALVLIFATGGVVLPRMWLSDRIKYRRKWIRKSLPFALDLLTLAVEAGLDFTTALIRISDRLGASPLGTEFRILIQEIQMGKIRSDALRDMADRVSVYELSSVVSALIQTDELGAPLGPVLRIQSEFIRTRRSQEAEEQAMKAPVKLLLPLIVFIFPTAFFMLFGPLVLKYYYGL